MYQIKYDYETGDSFGSEDREDILEINWEDLDKAKEALQRIKEHYLWYDYKNCHYSWKEEKKAPRPKWHKSKYDFVINLILDNGNEVQFTAPWCGYFETLYGADITNTPNTDTDMGFTI